MKILFSQTCLIYRTKGIIDELQVNGIIDNNSKPTREILSSFFDSPLSQYSANITPQDQNGDEPTPILPVRNQSILQVF